MEIRRNLCLPVIILAIVSGSGVVLPSEPVWAKQANSQAEDDESRKNHLVPKR